MSSEPHVGSPLVLLVNDEEWAARSVDTVLKQNGYSVLLAYTAKQGLDLAGKIKADCVLIDQGLPDMRGEDLCARIREVPTIRDSTPIVVMSASALPRATRLECLRNGAWDVLGLPFDTEEFLARLNRFVRAKWDADYAFEQSHLDPLTGFYNAKGLTRRVDEVVADAVRHDRPLACLALGIAGEGAEGKDGATPGAMAGRGDSAAEAAEMEAVARGIARVLSAITRVSDIVARVGNNDFVILAPSTDEAGAQLLVDRIFDGFGDLRDVGIRAGFHATSHPRAGHLRAEDLLTRATASLRQAQAESEGGRVKSFDPGAN